MRCPERSATPATVRKIENLLNACANPQSAVEKADGARRSRRLSARIVGSTGYRAQPLLGKEVEAVPHAGPRSVRIRRRASISIFVVWLFFTVASPASCLTLATAWLRLP